VVGTLMTNMAVEQALKARGVELVRAKVGDRYVLEELAARGWQLGGEGSGTCWRWTSTPPATASSARCRCCRPCGAAAGAGRPARRAWSCSRRR
jgi:hypothetical protein